MPSKERKRPSRAEYLHAVELRRTLRGFLRRSELATRAHGLTSERYQLLLMIKAENDRNGGATVTGLCEPLQLGQSAVTQLVRRAEDLGLLRRELSSRDARVRYLRLTPEGELRLAGAVAELRPERERLLAVLGQLSGEERRAHRRAATAKTKTSPGEKQIAMHAGAREGEKRRR